MPSPGKISSHPDPHNFLGHTRSDNSCPKAENIGIIMFPAHPGGKRLMTEGSPDARCPVRRHGHTDTSPANEYASFADTFLNEFTDSLGKFRIVN